MNADDFEKQLQHAPLREVPAQWRGEILDACRCALTEQADKVGDKVRDKVGASSPPSMVGELMVDAGSGCRQPDAVSSGKPNSYRGIKRTASPLTPALSPLPASTSLRRGRAGVPNEGG